MPASKKIGLLGGTFDPIHNGHLHIAEQVLHRLQLDEVWLIPNNQSPQREKPRFSTQDRYKMCELALENTLNLKLCDIEINTQKNYTIDTIQKLQSQYPDYEFYLILGMDAYLNFDTWHQAQDLLKLVQLIVVNRADFTPPDTNSKAIFVNIPPIKISASEIRNNPKAHQTDMPEAVWDYLKDRI